MAQEQLPRTFMDEFRALQREVAALRKATPLANASITRGGLRVASEGGINIEEGGNLQLKDGGSIVIRDGGDFFVLYPESEESAVYAGDIYSSVDGTYQGTGLLVQQPDGDDILTARSAVDGRSLVVLRDADGLSVLATDDAGGLTRPLLPLHPWRADSRTWSATGQGTFTILAGAMLYRTSPQVVAHVLHTVTTAGTTGEIRVMANGVQVGSTVTNSDTSVRTAILGPAEPGNNLDELIDLTVEARRTGGTGEVKAELKFATSWPG